ncbi:ArsR/SmtB family transcription factor [Brucella intermedia]|uniref:ArsR/SmtB family transcription factor n=1 Tax=Brucella intermedia TaxID=94625 RepID=UPI003B638309
MNQTTAIESFEISNDVPKAAAVFAAMGNNRRIQILSILLRHGELNVNVLAHMVGLSQSALSQHLKRLRDCGVVSTRRERQCIHYRVTAPVIGSLLTTYSNGRHLESTAALGHRVS